MSENKLKIRLAMYCKECSSAIEGEWHDCEPYANCKCPKCKYEFTLHLGGD
jgi:hypothetical protein